MTTKPDQYIEIATDILKRCSGYDLWFPHPSQTAIAAWANAFAESRLTRDELIAGVDHAYNHEAPGYRPLPASILQHARTARLDALRAQPDERRHRIDDACHALQDMGFTPPQAHRISRQIALGQRTDVQLTAAQKAELQQKLAARDELAQTPTDPRANPFHRILTRIADQKAIPS
ncbi:hypothetical protein [Nocardia sp. NPDC004860]|uniref:hypothetical protein n=1 Tax=Nocardia sp. NPDC004860 TaxID=3154557 RepID=UPI0033A00083